MTGRKSIRMPGYDYSLPGAYFVTCAGGERLRPFRTGGGIFGDVKNNRMILNGTGLIVAEQWEWLFNQYPYLRRDEYVVMPDHFHGILHITAFPVQAGKKIKPLPELIGAFKTTSSKMIHLAGMNDFKWQKSYHDRVIRDDDELNRIRIYIRNNPRNWHDGGDK